MVIENTSVRGQVSCVAIWVDSLAFKSFASQLSSDLPGAGSCRTLEPAIARYASF